VQFRYDDEAEYVDLAHERPTDLASFGSTAIDNFPVVVSALFDDQGILRGLRIVSDPRRSVDAQARGAFLGEFLQRRFGREGWQCTDLPRAEGETPVAGTYIKQDCTKTTDDRVMRLETRLYRKPGQTALDPVFGRPTLGLLESTTRMEIYERSAAPSPEGG
jgi:hypothetical protein